MGFPILLRSRHSDQDLRSKCGPWLHDHLDFEGLAAGARWIEERLTAVERAFGRLDEGAELIVRGIILRHNGAALDLCNVAVLVETEGETHLPLPRITDEERIVPLAVNAALNVVRGPELCRALAGLGLALIGDPKQAIYAFRGADVFTYLAAREDAGDRARRTWWGWRCARRGRRAMWRA